MSRRTDLHTLLKAIIGSDAVYFQPPPTVQMVYPCIVYERSKYNSRYADNRPYILEQSYQVTVIDKNPDSPILDKVAHLPRCSHDRHFTADNLNHDVFNLIY